MKAWGSKKVFHAENMPPVKPWQLGEFLGPSVQHPFWREPAPVEVAVQAVAEPEVAEAAVPEQEVETVHVPTPEELEALRQSARIEGYQEGFEKGKADGYSEGLPRGEEEGRAQGMEAAMASARESVHADVQRLQALLENVQQTVTGFEEALAEPVMSLALVVARQIVRGTLDEQPERIANLVREALAGMPELHGQIKLEMHPDDITLCKTYLEAEALAGHWRFEPNAEMERGGCKISNASLELDLTLPTRWRRVHDVLHSQADGDAHHGH